MTWFHIAVVTTRNTKNNRSICTPNTRRTASVLRPTIAKHDMGSENKVNSSMTVRIELRDDGSHSPGYTRDVAAATAECIRVLASATGEGTHGIETAEDLYDVLAALHFAALRLPTVLEQLAKFLDGHQQLGRLVHDDGDSESNVADVVAALTQARDDAMTLAAALETAWSWSGALHTRSS